MRTSRFPAVIACLALAGCAACREHPNICGAVTFVTVACATAVLHHHHRGDRAHDLGLKDPHTLACTVQPNGSCR